MRAQALGGGLIVAAAVAVVAWLAWPAAPAGAGFDSGRPSVRQTPALSGHGGPHPAESPQPDPSARPLGAAPPVLAPAGAEPPREPGMRYVRVVDSVTGRAVPGVRVHDFYLEDRDRLDWNEFAEGGEPADRWGRVPLEIDLDDDEATYWMASAGGGRFSPAIPTPRGHGDFTLTLLPGNVITGVARDIATGAPIAGAEVTLAMGDNGSSAFGSGRDARTDPAGRYRFAGLPAGIAFCPMLRHEEQFSGPDVSDEWELWGWDASGRVAKIAETLPAMLARGRAKNFGGLGRAHTIDLSAGVNPGVRVTYTLTMPAGTEHHGRVRFELPQDGVADAEWDGGWLFPQDGIATWEAFLGVGTFHARACGNGVRLRAPPKVVTGSGPPERIVFTLERTRPLLVQFVDETGAPLRRAGLTLSAGLLRRERAPADPARPAAAPQADITAFAKQTSDAQGRIAVDLPLLPWEDTRARAATFFLAAVGADLFDVQPGLVGPAHVPFDAVDVRRRLDHPGTEPVILRVPARSWAPLRVRVVSQTRQPLGGVTVQGRPAAQYHGAATAVTDSDGYASFRVVAAAGMGPSSGPGEPPNPEDATRAPEDTTQVLSANAPGLAGRLSTHLGVAYLSYSYQSHWPDRRPRPAGYEFVEYLEPGVITIVAVPARTVTVRLRNSDGTPAANRWGWFSYTGQPRQTGDLIQADGSGRAQVQVPETTRSVTLGFVSPFHGALESTLASDADTAEFTLPPLPAPPRHIRHH